MVKESKTMFEELDDLVEVIHSPAYFFDMETRQILAVNRDFAALMGYERCELLKMSMEMLRPAEEIARMQIALASSPPQGSMELRYKTSSGKILLVQIKYRNSVFVDNRSSRSHDVRMVVVSKWAAEMDSSLQHI